MPTDTQRAPTEDAQACGEDVLYILGCNAHRIPEHTMNALIIAIAKRVREARAETCGHDPKNLGTARITAPNGRTRWATICTACECIVSDAEAPHA